MSRSSPRKRKSHRACRTLPRAESLEARQLLSVSIDNATMYFSNAKASNTPPSAPRAVTLTNTGNSPIDFSTAAITGDSSFAISQEPTTNTVIPAGGTAQVAVEFTAPTTTSGVTLHTAMLTINTTDATNPSVTVNLRAFALTGYQGGPEPSLAQVIETLYQMPVNIGFPLTTLDLPYEFNGTLTVLYGSEVPAQRFVKASSGPVTVKPLDTFGPAASVPYTGTDYTFGYYTPGQSTPLTPVYDATTPVGSPSGGDGQTVNPIAHPYSGDTVSTDGDNVVTFDPGSNPFGIYTFFPVETPNETAYSEDPLNASNPIVSPNGTRRIRFWQAMTPGGAIIPNTYIGAVEEAYNNDIQDVVFEVSNITLIAPSVTGVSVAASTGSPFQIPTGSAQLSNIHLANVNQINITFDENVNVTSGDLTVTGNSGAYGIQSFSYNSTTFTATWTLASTISTDHVQLALAGVTDTSGSAIALDGEWTDGTSTFPSGNGVAGGNFNFSFNVQPVTAVANYFQNFNSSGSFTNNFTATAGSYNAGSTSGILDQGGTGAGGGVTSANSTDNSAVFNQGFTNLADLNTHTISMMVKDTDTSTSDKPLQLGWIASPTEAFNGTAPYAFISARILGNTEVQEQSCNNGTVSNPTTTNFKTAATSGDWLQLTFTAKETNTTTGAFNVTYSVIDFGPNGTSPGNVLVASTATTETTAGMANVVGYPGWRDSIANAAADNFSLDPANTAPSAPTLSITNNEGQTNLSWNAVTGANTYTILRSATTGTETALAVNIATTSFVDTSAVSGTKYFYTVEALNGTAASSPSNEVVSSPPGQVTGLGPVGENGAVTLGWSPTPGATSYQVMRADYNPVTKMVTDSYVNQGNPVTGNTFTQAVTPGNYYSYEVVPSNSFGTGTASTAVVISAPGTDTTAAVNFNNGATDVTNNFVIDHDGVTGSSGTNTATFQNFAWNATAGVGSGGGVTTTNEDQNLNYSDTNVNLAESATTSVMFEVTGAPGTNRVAQIGFINLLNSSFNSDNDSGAPFPATTPPGTAFISIRPDGNGELEYTTKAPGGSTSGGILEPAGTSLLQNEWYKLTFSLTDSAPGTGQFEYLAQLDDYGASGSALSKNVYTIGGSTAVAGFDATNGSGADVAWAGVRQVTDTPNLDNFSLTGVAIPSWLAPTSAATWNGTTLTVTGAATIIADPGSAEPNIVASGAAAQLTIAPASPDVDVHVGGITLTNGAGITMASVGAGRTHSNHNVLVIGTLGAATDPTVSVDAGSKIDMEDNDLVVHTGTSDTSGQAELATIQALAATGRNVAPGGVFDGTWNGNGLTSSTAASVDGGLGYEQNVLAVELFSDMFLGETNNQWVVGNATENLGANDILVKYTYNGDLALDGAVDGNAATIFSSYFVDNAGVPVNDYAFGDLNGDGSINGNDATIFSSLFGNGLAGSGLSPL